ALVDGQEATLKTLHKRGHQVALKPANPDHSTQILPADRVRIQGKLVTLLRRY
ncbi:MAG: LexA family protein, partial [Alphaproteobacteria bacterium]